MTEPKTVLPPPKPAAPSVTRPPVSLTPKDLAGRIGKRRDRVRIVLDDRSAPKR